jgi:hypothetical protein
MLPQYNIQLQSLQHLGYETRTQTTACVHFVQRMHTNMKAYSLAEVLRK